MCAAVQLQAAVRRRLGRRQRAQLQAAMCAERERGWRRVREARAAAEAEEAAEMAARKAAAAERLARREAEVREIRERQRMAARADRRLRGVEAMAARVKASRLRAAVQQWRWFVRREAEACAEYATQAERLEKQAEASRAGVVLQRPLATTGRKHVTLSQALAMDPGLLIHAGGVPRICGGGDGSSEPERWRRMRQAQEVLAREFGPDWAAQLDRNLAASREEYQRWQSDVVGLVGAAPAGAVQRGATGLQRGSSGAAAGREDG